MMEITSALNALSNNIIKDHDFNLCVEEMKSLIERSDGVCEALLIVGEPGCGKTFVAEYVLQKFNPAVDAEISKKSILMIRQIESISIAAFYEALLNAMGDPLPSQGKLSDKKARIIKLKERLGVVCVLLDEFHDMLPSTVHERSVSIKFTKWLMVELKVNVVMLGLPECLQVIRYSSQLETRIRRVIRLYHFSLVDDEQAKRFGSFMRALFKFSPKTIDNFFDKSGEMLKRFMLATQGNKRIIKRLLKIAVEKSSSSNGVSLISLHEAWLFESSKVFFESKQVAPFRANIEQVNNALNEQGLM